MKKKLTCLVLLAALSLLVSCASSSPQVSPGNRTTTGMQGVLASYPDQGKFENVSAEDFTMSEDYSLWWQEAREKADRSSAEQTSMKPYYESILQTLLLSGEGSNQVCSPLNLYLALSMLAELTDKESREQVLQVLQVSDLFTLRERVSVLWEANYADTPLLQSLLADSVWLREGDDYRGDTLQTLADVARASVFTGKMGTPEMDQALQQWMNDNTGHMLESYIEDIHTDPDTVLALVSTIYYKAAWQDNFSESATDRQVFHGKDADAEVDMMHQAGDMAYYTGSSFHAVSKSLTDSGQMYFFLPDEGTDVRDLVSDPEVFAVLDGSFTNTSYPRVRLSLPKFSVSAKMNLLDALDTLGIKDVTDPAKADFSPVKDDASGLVLSSAEHAAIVEVDEDGVAGAAYTIMMMMETAMMDEPEEVEFTLDRPFYFIITGMDHSLLFAGIVQQIP